MKYLRQNTAVTIDAGPFNSVLDAVTPLEALTSQPGTISKNGVVTAFTPASWGGGPNGDYSVGLAASDVDTIGRLRVRWTSPSIHIPVWEDYMVLNAAAYDQWFAAGSAATDELEFDLRIASS